MKKKIVAGLLSATMLLGAAEALPNDFLSGIRNDITVSAAVSGDFEYKVLSDGTAEITGYKGSFTILTIPETIGGKTVSKIGDQAFYMCKLKQVFIPKTVKTVGKDAFRESASLNSVTFKGGTTTIGSYAFYKCTNLTSVKLCSGLKTIDNYVFYGCTSLKSLEIPDSVTSLGSYQFENCSSLKSVTLPNGISEIKDDTFAWCTSLESIRIPDKVKSIGWCAFASCTGLKRAILPNSLKTLADDSFNRCTSLTAISLLNGLTKIGDGAFENCTGLTSVAIPSAVTSIGKYAFGFLHATKAKEHTKYAKDFTVYGYNTVAENFAKQYKFSYIDARLTSGKAIIPCVTCTYTGHEIKPTVTVKNVYGKVLTEGKHYTTSYSNNRECGKATITITGTGNYSGTLTKNFTITAANINNTTITGLKNKYYTGKAVKQNFTVKLGNVTLVNGTDYTVSYKNNTAIGKATITLKGKGNYTGTVSKTFKICPNKTTLKSAKSPKTKQLKVTYSKVSGVTGYQIKYSTSKKFTKKTTKTVNAKGTSKTISKLKKGKVYYVKVRTYKTVGGTKYFSGYSKTKKVTIK